MKKYKKIISYLVLAILFLTFPVEAEGNEKTIMLVLDDLDFKRIENIVDNYYGLGFLNIKSRSPSSREGLYMSIGAARKLKLGQVDYKGLSTEGESLVLKGYDDFYKRLLRENDGLELELLGDRLRTSYIGDDTSALLAADSQGRIDYGLSYIDYDRNWLRENTENALSKTDLLVLSYKLEDQNAREEILRHYINDFRNHRLLILPRSVSKNINFIFNRNLTPIIYIKDGRSGILTSKSTRREGFISLEDIGEELVGEDKSLAGIGEPIDIVEEDGLLEKAIDIFRLSFNLLLIAGLFQGLVYLNQLVTCYSIYREEETWDIGLFNRFILINILVGLLLGVFKLHRYILVYLPINIFISYYLAKRLENEDRLLGKLSSLIYIFMNLAIILRPEIIYNSYFGFNNLFYGARYYGFNNGAMAIYLASSILSYFYLREKFKGNRERYVLGFIIFGLNMLVLSAARAANTGGFITALILFLTMIYLGSLEDKSSIKKILILLGLGLLIFGLNMYFDSRSLNQSHAIGFLRRIRESGMSELINMIRIKLGELIKYSLMPPFSIVILMQILSIRKLDGLVEGETKMVSRLLFFISVVAFIINDTGMIAFIFINQFTIGNMLENLKMEVE